MVIIMQGGATKEQIEQVIRRTHDAGLKTQMNVGEQCTVIAVIGDKTALSDTPIESMSGVARTMPISAPYKLASRQFHEENTVISVDGVKIGGKQLAMMAGPCAVENTEQIVQIAKHVVESGAQFIRGGAFKPRTGPYSFHGYGESALEMLATAREETGLRVVTEVMTPHEVGRHGKPVILKRGLSSTIEEWLLAAEYILSEGNPNVILCERGIRTYETHTRNTLDLNAVPAIKELSHLPIIVDPSHGTGIRSYVPAMAKAAIAAGSDGLIVEVHHDPDNSMTGDGVQSLFPDQFNQLLQDLRQIAIAVDREI